MDGLAGELAKLTESINTLKEDIGGVKTGLEAVRGTTTDTNDKIGNIREDVDALDKKHEKLAETVKKNTEKVAKNATNNVMIRKEQYNIKVAIERLHQLVEKNREESVRDKIEARDELRNVIINKLPRALLKRSYGGGRSPHELTRFAYDAICQFTDRVDSDEVLSVMEIGRKSKEHVRLKIELASSNLAETVANIGRKAGYDVRQGKLYSEREFMAAQYKLSAALNERNSNPEYYFSVRRGTRIVLRDKETDQIVQEVPVPTSDELADCLVKFDLPIYADLAEGPEDEDEEAETSEDESMDLEPDEARELAAKKEQKKRDRMDREVARGETRKAREQNNLQIRRRPFQRNTNESNAVEDNTSDDNGAEGWDGEETTTNDGESSNGGTGDVGTTSSTQESTVDSSIMVVGPNETNTTANKKTRKRSLAVNENDENDAVETPAKKKDKKDTTVDKSKTKKDKVQAKEGSGKDSKANRGNGGSQKGGGNSRTRTSGFASAWKPAMPSSAQRSNPPREAKTRAFQPPPRRTGGGRRGRGPRRGNQTPIMSENELRNLLYPLAAGTSGASSSNNGTASKSTASPNAGGGSQG